MRERSSLTPTGKASKAQVRRVRTLTNEATEAALEKGSFSHDELQTVHTNGGEYKAAFAENFVAFLCAFARKMRGIVTPRRAEETGLIPNGWSVQERNGVKQDSPEGEVDLANLDYDSSALGEGESYVDGDTMLARGIEVSAIGSLGFAAELLKAQDGGKEIFPVESHGRHYFIMPLTILLDGLGGRRVACFHWDGKRWVFNFDFVGLSFDSHGRFVRVRDYLYSRLKVGAGLVLTAVFSSRRAFYRFKCDIKKFFASIDHEILKNILGGYIPDEDICWLLEEIILSFRTPIRNPEPRNWILNQVQDDKGRGLPLGNLTSQLLVNVYMNEFDQFVKHKLKAKYYIRYADDFVILHPNREVLTLKNETLQSYLGLLKHGDTFKIRKEVMNNYWLFGVR